MCILNAFCPWPPLSYQAKTMGKVTTFMKRVASQNLILQYYPSLNSLEDYAILCLVERCFSFALSLRLPSLLTLHNVTLKVMI